MKLKKVLKIVRIIILILLVLFFIHTIRNFIIIKDMQNKVVKYTESSNYHIKSISKQNHNLTVNMEYYQKDNKQVVFLERIAENGITKISIYNNGERIDTFTETADSKTVNLDSINEVTVQVVNILETDNDWQTFLCSGLTKVKRVKVNEKECYLITNFFSPYFMYDGSKDEAYLEKETGLLLKQITSNMTTEKEYEFDNVDEKIFIEPNIGEYTLQQ